MTKFKIVLAVLIAAFLLVFAIENMEAIELSILGFKLETRRIVLIVAVLGLGFVLGKLIRILPNRRAESASTPHHVSRTDDAPASH